MTPNRPHSWEHVFSVTPWLISWCVHLLGKSHNVPISEMGIRSVPRLKGLNKTLKSPATHNSQCSIRGSCCYHQRSSEGIPRPTA